MRWHPQWAGNIDPLPEHSDPSGGQKQMPVHFRREIQRCCGVSSESRVCSYAGIFVREGSPALLLFLTSKAEQSRKNETTTKIMWGISRVFCCCIGVHVLTRAEMNRFMMESRILLNNAAVIESTFGELGPGFTTCFRYEDMEDPAQAARVAQFAAPNNFTAECLSTKMLSKVKIRSPGQQVCACVCEVHVCACVCVCVCVCVRACVTARYRFPVLSFGLLLTLSSIFSFSKIHFT